MASGSDAKYRYDMSHVKRGKCVIINNIEFTTSSSRRVGSNVDVASLEEVFQFLGFQVSVKLNQTAEEMKQLAEKLASEDHTDSDCVAMVIMSHGGECDVIEGTDGLLMLEDIYKPFMLSKTLAGKPKLFFIQACRGDRYDDGIELQGAGQNRRNQNPVQRIPQKADFLYAYSTPPGYYAYRDRVGGSWFIQAIKEVFMKYGKILEIYQLMLRVNNELSYDEKYEYNTGDTSGKKQVSCFLSMLNKELYFTPKC